jgi:hypothetical protein
MKKKQRKVKAAKANPRKAKIIRKSRTPRRQPPKAAMPAAAPQASQSPAVTFPALAHILKGSDKIPVTVTDQAHLDRLTSEHGAGSVEVQK